MSQPAKLLFAALALGSASFYGAEPQVQDLVLDDHTVYIVPVSGTRVTTVSFPSPITAIDGALMTTDGKTPGVFQVAHTKGTAYFSARALAKGATANLNVRWNNRTYVFELKESIEPCYSMILRSSGEKNGLTRPLTPNRLLGLLDKAKAFPLLQRYQPDLLHDSEYRDFRAKPLVSDCGDYEIHLIEALRFPREDTLVFHLTVSNKSQKPLQHSPERLAIRVAEHTFTPSLADLANTVAPHSSVTGYITLTGTPTGGRNDLSLKNEFSFSLARLHPTIEAAARDFEAIQHTGLAK